MAGTITVKILGDASNLGKASKEASSHVEGIGKSVGKIGGLVAGAFSVGAIVDFGKKSVEAAAEEEKSKAILATTLKNTTGAREEDIKKTEEWIEKQALATGISKEHLTPALATLVRATHNTAEAQTLLGTAMDAATGTGKPLETISLALAKAHNGNTAALGKLGIATKDVHGKTLSYQQIVENLNKTYTGSAAAAANTFQGHLARLHEQFQQVEEKVGTALIPIIEKLATILITKVVPAVQQVAHWFGEHKAVAIALGIAIAAAVAPVITITGAIAALVVGIIYAYNNFKTFHDVVNTTISTVQQIISTFVSVATGLWRTFGGTITAYVVGTFKAVREVIQGALNVVEGIFKLFRDFFTGHWSKLWDDAKQILKGAWQLIWGSIQGFVVEIKAYLAAAWIAVENTIKFAFGGIISWFAALPGRILSAIGSLKNTLVNAGSDLIHGMANGIGFAFGAVTSFLTGLPGRIVSALPSLLGTLAGAGGDLIRGLWDGIKSTWNHIADLATFNLPKVHIPGTSVDIGGGSISLLPHLAKGAIVTKPTLAVIGEAGPEAVLPLSGRNAGVGRPVVFNYAPVIHTAVTPQALAVALEAGYRNGSLNPFLRLIGAA